MARHGILPRISAPGRAMHTTTPQAVAVRLIRRRQIATIQFPRIRITHHREHSRRRGTERFGTRQLLTASGRAIHITIPQMVPVRLIRGRLNTAHAPRTFRRHKFAFVRSSSRPGMAPAGLPALRNATQGRARPGIIRTPPMTDVNLIPALT